MVLRPSIPCPLDSLIEARNAYFKMNVWLYDKQRCFPIDGRRATKAKEQSEETVLAKYNLWAIRVGPRQPFPKTVKVVGGGEMSIAEASMVSKTDFDKRSSARRVAENKIPDEVAQKNVELEKVNKRLEVKNKKQKAVVEKLKKEKTATAVAAKNKLAAKIREDKRKPPAKAVRCPPPQQAIAIDYEEAEPDTKRRRVINSDEPKANSTQ